MLMFTTVVYIRILYTYLTYYYRRKSTKDPYNLNYYKYKEKKQL